MPALPLHHSKGEVNRAGERLRMWRAEGESSDPSVETALEVLTDFRSCFQYPMTKVRVGLRQFVERESDDVITAQRLKRTPQILDKLVKNPGSDLARMEDVGGCRAVLRDRQQIDGVLRRIKRNWDVKRVRDYIEEPKPEGYRALHVVVERDDRRIEIQLRTHGQQAWAEAIERTAGRLTLPLKDGKGPDDLLAYFRLAAEGIASDELGIPIESDFEDRFEAAQLAAAGYFR